MLPTAALLRPYLAANCDPHQRRLGRGDGRLGFDEPARGYASGHGQYDISDVNGLGILCYECGNRFASVGVHISRAYQLDANWTQTGTNSAAPSDRAMRQGKKMARSSPCSAMRRCQTLVATHGKLSAERQII